MKKFMLIIVIFSISTPLFAKTINISYGGVPIKTIMNLSEGDVVMINTTIPVGTKVHIGVTPTKRITHHSFTFISSMENLSPNRNGPFTDRMYTGANPGWVSYTYTGKNDIETEFKLTP